MNLVLLMTSPTMVLLSLLLIPSSKKETQEKMSKMSAIFMLMQTMLLHTETTQNKQMNLLLPKLSTNMQKQPLILPLYMDTTSTMLLLLTSMLLLTTMMMSKKTMYYSQKMAYMSLFTTTLMLFSAFTTPNMMIFYMLFESAILPLIMMMGLWGSRKEKTRAAYFFFLYTMIGSLPLFMTMLLMYYKLKTFNITMLHNTMMNKQTQMKLFMGLFLAFAMKTPLIPWHTWLPLAHVEAPAMGSVMLAGMLLKLGTYGFLRFTTSMLPLASKFLAPMIMTMSMTSSWLASLNSLRQNDIKRMMAYSSMAHMGMMTAACFSTNNISTKGATMLMISHGLTSSTLFILVSCLYERHKSRLMKNFQGMNYTTPLLSTLTLFTILAHMSTPGSMNFMGEYLCLLGLWELHPSMSMMSTPSLLMTTTFLMLLYTQTTSSKPPMYTKYKMQDISLNETHAILTLTTPNVMMGLMPYPMMNDTKTLY